MRSGFIVAIVGIVLVLIAAGVLVFAFSQATQIQKTISVPANGTQDYVINCEKGTYYMIHISSEDGNFTYELIDPAGNVVDNSTNASTYGAVSLNATETGDYTLRIHNMEAYDIQVQIMVMSQSDIMSLAMNMLGALALCCVGLILALVGFIIGLLQGKKQKQPVYQPPPPSPPQPPESGGGYQEV